MRRQSETCFLVALALIASTLGLSFASAQQKIAREETSVKDKFTENFLAQHEIGRRFRIDPAELPASEDQRDCHQPVADCSTHSGQTPQVRRASPQQRLRLVSSTKASYSSCPTATFWSLSKALSYLTLLRDDGTGKALLD